MSVNPGKPSNLDGTDTENGDLVKEWNQAGLNFSMPQKLPPVKPTATSLSNSARDTKLRIDESLAEIKRGNSRGLEWDVSLMLSRHETIPLKDLRQEEKAKTMKNIIERAHILLDLHETRLDDITTKMLTTVFEYDSNFDILKAMDAIFTHDSVHCLSRMIQGASHLGSGGFDYDQSWVTVLGLIPDQEISQTVAICQLKHATNLGHTSQEVKFVIFVLASQSEAKEAVITGQALATMFADLNLRQELQEVHKAASFKRLLSEHTEELAKQQYEQNRLDMRKHSTSATVVGDLKGKFYPGRGMVADLKRRLPHYVSDIKDGITGPHTITKVLSSSIFLYFSCLLPTMAFGIVNYTNTNGAIGMKEHILAQTIAGLLFALIGGQPLIIILTTAPIILFINSQLKRYLQYLFQ